MPHSLRSSLLVLTVAAAPWAALGATPFHVSGTFDPRRPEDFRRRLPELLPVRLRARGPLTEVVDAR